MARNYNKARTLAKPRSRPDLMAIVREGYMDAKQGKGFAHFYESLPRWSQNNYEIGRLCAAYLGFERAPNWPNQTIMPRWLEGVKNVVCRDLAMRHPATEEGA